MLSCVALRRGAVQGMSAWVICYVDEDMGSFKCSMLFFVNTVDGLITISHEVHMVEKQQSKQNHIHIHTHT